VSYAGARWAAHAVRRLVDRRGERADRPPWWTPGAGATTSGRREDVHGHEPRREVGARLAGPQRNVAPGRWWSRGRVCFVPRINGTTRPATAPLVVPADRGA